MKKIILMVVCLMATALFVNAQKKETTYKAVKVDVGIGYALPAKGGNTVGGLAFTVEPHYRVTDAISAGLRFEGAALGFKDPSGGKVSLSVLYSYAVTGEYYFKQTGFRPFAGVGMGIFTRKSVSLDIDSSGSTGPIVMPSVSSFGFFPKAGFETGHFRLSAEYDIMKGGGYIAFKLGFFIGGGKKKAVATKQDNSSDSKTE